LVAFFFFMFCDAVMPRSSKVIFISIHVFRLMGCSISSMYDFREAFQKDFSKLLVSGMRGAGLAVWTAGDLTVSVLWVMLWSDQLVGIEVGLELVHPNKGQ
jgi:hypothetical protein